MSPEAAPHHERIDDPIFRHAVDLIDSGDAEGLRSHLADHPDLIGKRVHFEEGGYFGHPCLLAFIAENPVRRGTLPANVCRVAEILLAAGPSAEMVTEALVLVCSGRVARECNVQVPLIEVLCRGGGVPDQAMPAALGHGEFEAVHALIEAGAAIDLTIAAATGREEAAELIETADSATRHRALALAAQHGHARIVQTLLDHGEDPNRHNPEGCHAHSTPLHQAALAGWADVVEALVSAGARLDITDTVHGGTPLDWARRGGQRDVVARLSQR